MARHCPLIFISAKNRRHSLFAGISRKAFILRLYMTNIHDKNVRSTGSGDIATYFKSVPVRVTVFITGTLLVALILNLALSILTLEKIYSKSLLSEYMVIGRYYVRKIELSLGFGKTLPKYTGMEKLLKSIKQDYPEIADIFIYSADKNPLFGLTGSGELTNSLALDMSVGEEELIKHSPGRYHLVFPLKSGSFKRKTLQGYFEILLPETIIRKKIKAMIVSSGKLMAIISVVSAVLFFFIVMVLIPTQKKKGRIYGISLRTRALIATSLVLILSQVGFSYFNVKDFRGRYFAEIQNKCRNLASLVQADINYLLKLGIPITRLIKIDAILNNVLDNIPELADIAIVDPKGKILYRVAAPNLEPPPKVTQKSPEPQQAEQSPNRIVLEVEQKQKIAGYIHLNISDLVIDRTIRDLILDSGTVAVVSLVIGFEFVFFLVAILIYGGGPKYHAPNLDKTVIDFTPPTGTQIPVRASVRTAAFLYAFSIALSMSFLPLYADSLYRPLLGLSREIIIGLPISTEMLFVAISLALGGYWLDRRGWLGPFITGALITGIGMALSGIARTPIELMIYRGIVGLGYGLTMMASQSVILNLTQTEYRSNAVTSLEAGYFSGFLSSTAVGGMLAEKIGFRGVFFVGSIMVLFSIVFVLAFLWQTRDSGKLIGKSAARPSSQKRMSRLFTDREFMGSLLLSAIPSSLCLVGFFVYASPLFLTKIGVNQSNIGRLLMPYGLSMVYIAPAISRWSDTLANKKIPVILGGIIGGVALLSFFFLNSIPLYVIVLVLFSISGGMSYGPRIALVSESKLVKDVGSGTALGMYNSLERIGNIVGPIVVGGMITVVGLIAAISSLGLIYLLGTLFFFFLVRTTSRA